MTAADLEERIDALYGLPNEEFVAARDALAKELRGEKRREDARAVAALRRPGQAEWAVEQVVRSQPAAVRALWAAGDELVAAQDAVMAGEGDPARLRAAMAQRRDALGPVSNALRGLLTGRGKELGAATVQAAIETFTAASADTELRREVAGRRASGPAEAAPAAEKPAEKPPSPPPKPRPRPAPEPRKPDRAKEKEARRRRDARLAAERNLEAAEGDRATAARRAEAAGRRLEEAEAAHAEAQERLREAEAAEGAARGALERLAG